MISLRSTFQPNAFIHCALIVSGGKPCRRGLEYADYFLQKGKILLPPKKNCPGGDNKQHFMVSSYSGDLGNVLEHMEICSLSFVAISQNSLWSEVGLIDVWNDFELQ